MRSARLRTSLPLTSVPPPPTSSEYSTTLANLAARILYRSPLPSQNDLPIYILNAAGFPDARNTDYDSLLPYVLTRLPDDDELIGGQGYEIVFFAGGGEGNQAMQAKKDRPGWSWFMQAYRLLTRAMRKRLRKLYIVHEKKWVRVLSEMFATVVSPKFRKKVVHVSSLSGLYLHILIEDLLIPPSAYFTDRRKSSSIRLPHAVGRRAFRLKQPLPQSADGQPRLSRVLREATRFLLMDENVTTAGLFRINARAQTVEILREAYDRGQKFIVWKEQNAVLASSHWREGVGDVSVAELDQVEGYELTVAAGLIKVWYKELREPIFPQSSYQMLVKYYSNPDVTIDTSQLVAMLSTDDGWSPISNKTSRKILTMHLLPLLSRITQFSEKNQMTPENLAVCFAPSLFRGPDPIEDLKISNIVRRILVAMISQWKELEPLLSTSFEKFQASLQTPEAVDDREDPFEKFEAEDAAEIETQVSGITLLDNDDSDSDTERSPPPLPPRPRAATVDTAVLNGSHQFSPSDFNMNRLNSFGDPAVGFSPTDSSPSSSINSVKRKPAPALLPLPRYSSIVTGRLEAIQGTRYYNTVPIEGEEPNGDRLSMFSNSDTLPLYDEEATAHHRPPPPESDNDTGSAEQSVQRKPLPKTASMG